MACEALLEGLETTDALIYFAKEAEQAERFDDMAKAMKKVTAREKKLSTEHRNLFSVAYKNVVGARRSSWRVISMIEQKTDIEKQKKLSKEMRERVETELDNTCSEVIEQLDALIKEAKGEAEDEVFYLKMKGDYYRYQAEYKNDDDLKNKANKAYEQALKVANGGENGDGKKLEPTHPNRLGLALNYSVFFYEILNKPDKACELAKTAFDDAACDLTNSKQEDNKDSTLIMQLLRDNLTLWTSDAQENGVDAQD